MGLGREYLWGEIFRPAGFIKRLRVVRFKPRVAKNFWSCELAICLFSVPFVVFKLFIWFSDFLLRYTYDFNLRFTSWVFFKIIVCK